MSSDNAPDWYKRYLEMTYTPNHGMLALIKKKATRKRNNVHEQAEDVLNSTEMNTIASTNLHHTNRALSVEELLSEFVQLKLAFCVKYAAAGFVFLVLPLIFDYVLFAHKIDYTAWKCTDTSSGLCSEATNGGSIYNKDVFCALDPIDNLPNELYVPEISDDQNGTDLSKYFIRDVNFTWTEDVSSYYTIRLSLYCDAETANQMDMIYIGVIISGFLSGLMVDRFGRRPPLIASSILGFILVLGLIFVVDYTGVVIIQFLHGILYSMYAISSFIWLSENIPRRYRTVTLILFSSMITLGRFIFAILVSEISDWKDITVCILVLCMLSSCCVYILPESVQFLLSHHLDSEARQALGSLSTKWQTYSKVLTLKTQSDKSHRDEDNFGALFTHKKVAYRVATVLLLWSISLLPLTNRDPSTLRLPVYHVMKASISWVVQLAVVGLMMFFHEKMILSGVLFLNAMFNLMALLFYPVAFNIVVQVLTEVCFLILMFLTVEVVPMPQRGSVFGLGYSFLGAAALINLHFFSFDNEDLVLRIIISVLLTIGAILCFLLPVFQNKIHPVSFTIGEAKKVIGKRTIVISEKELFTSTPSSSDPAMKENVASSSDTVLPADSDSNDTPPRNLKYIVYNKAAHTNRYIFLDKGNRRLDILFEKKGDSFRQKSGKEPIKNHSGSSEESDSLVIVNVFRDKKLEKSFHQRSPSIVIDYDSEFSDINDVYVVEEDTIRDLMSADNQSPVYTMPVKRRNPQSSAIYLDMPLTTEEHDQSSGNATVGSNTSVLSLDLGEGDSDGTFELVTPTTIQEVLLRDMPLQLINQSEELSTHGSEEQTMEFSECEESDVSPATQTLRKFNTHMQLETVEVASERVASESASLKDEKWRNMMGALERKCDGDNNDYIRYETPDIPSPETIKSRDESRVESRVISFTEFEFSMYDESPIHWFPLSSAGNQFDSDSGEETVNIGSILEFHPPVDLF